MYFACMKTLDSNNQTFYYMTSESQDIASLIDDVMTVERLTSDHPIPARVRKVIDDRFEQTSLQEAIENINLGVVKDFDWTFVNKYDKVVGCYVTTNV